MLFANDTWSSANGPVTTKQSLVRNGWWWGERLFLACGAKLANDWSACFDWHHLGHANRV